MPPPLATRYTTTTGPGAAAAQPQPSASLGGFAATTAWGGGVLYDLFNRASSTDAAGGRADYRCVYVAATDPAASYAAVRVYLAPQSAGGTGLAAGADPRPVTYLDSPAPQAVDVANGFAAPAGVTFTSPVSYATGVSVGDLDPNTGRAVWLRRTPAVTADGAAEACDVIFATAAGAVTVRRVYWQVEQATTPTAPVRPPTFVATASPFRRATVDFLTAGGARVTWALDPTLVDAGPYDFQLQTGQSGGANADDWTDAGPPARDAVYLLDPTRRLWGVSSTLHYRVVLTTAVATYVSPPANVYGNLKQEQWLHLREIVRKETLNLRRLVGTDGFLLKARRYGPLCPCTDPYTREVGNSNCATCYGQGIVGGYHPSVPSYFADVTNEKAREHVAYNENAGTVRPVTIQARTVATLPVVQRDAWVAVGSDERYYCTAVAELATRVGVPIVYGVELRLAPRSDVLYTVPVVRPDDPPPDYWQIDHIAV